VECFADRWAAFPSSNPIASAASAAQSSASPASPPPPPARDHAASIAKKTEKEAIN